MTRDEAIGRRELQSEYHRRRNRASAREVQDFVDMRRGMLERLRVRDDLPYRS
ncbi:MAG: hypothetical protein LC791_00175 [Acidobacteria bacterium]|nr:hypothetical protein [Acidobacteriota bacterium]